MTNWNYVYRPREKKRRKLWKLKASGTSNNRGWENRTPAKSFGDFCHTIWPIPYIWYIVSIYLQNRIHILYICYHTTLSFGTQDLAVPFFLPSWSSPRPISNSQLHTLLHFHLCPIYLVVFKGSYFFRMGYLILRGASRLDAFSVYPGPTWLPGHAPGGATGPPAVSPSRSSRTKDSSSQISCAHAG